MAGTNSTSTEELPPGLTLYMSEFDSSSLDFQNLRFKQGSANGPVIKEYSPTSSYGNIGEAYFDLNLPMVLIAYFLFDDFKEGLQTEDLGFDCSTTSTCTGASGKSCSNYINQLPFVEFVV